MKELQIVLIHTRIFSQVCCSSDTMYPAKISPQEKSFCRITVQLFSVLICSVQQVHIVSCSSCNLFLTIATCCQLQMQFYPFSGNCSFISSRCNFLVHSLFLSPICNISSCTCAPLQLPSCVPLQLPTLPNGKS